MAEFSEDNNVCLSVQGVCTEAGMYALRERRVHVTQEDFELAVAKVGFLYQCCVQNVELRVSSNSDNNNPLTEILTVSLCEHLFCCMMVILV